MPESQPQETPPRERHRRLPGVPPRNGPLTKLRRYLYRKWPRLTSDPDEQERLGFWWEKDGEENARTAPPVDEFIDLHCLWAAEFYTPAHIESLLDGFAKLGWDKIDEDLPNRNPAVWVRQLRQTSRGRGWLNLHLIVRPGDKRFGGPKRTAPLPPSVDHATATIFSLTSSLTCVVVCFVLTDEASRRFESALRQERKTTSKPTRRGYSIIRPSQQKEAAIQAIRSDMRAVAANWFRENLPGLFAAGILDGEHPTCEFVTLRRAQPFPKREEGSAKPADYLRVLAMDLDVDAWEWDKFSKFKFVWPLFPAREARFHGIMAVNENDFDEEALRGYGGRTRSAYQTYVDSRLKGLLSRWSILGLLSAFDRHLNAVRDSATFQSSRNHKPPRVLRELGNMLSKSIDVAAVSSELTVFSGERSSFFYEVETFKPVHPEFYRDKEGTTLSEVLREDVAERARSLETTDRSVRDLLTQYGAILGARENIKLQRTVGRLTWFLVILTIAILALTAVLTFDSFK